MASVFYLSEPVRECLYRAHNREAMAAIHFHNGNEEEAISCRNTAQGYRAMALQVSLNPTMPFYGDFYESPV